MRQLGWLAAAGLVALALFRNRLWATPNLVAFSEIAERLGDNPLEGGPDYLLTSPIGPWVARLVGQTRPHEYARLHLVILAAGLAGVLWLAARQLRPSVAWVLAVVIVASPALTTSMQWLGQPDAFTLPIALALALVRPRWALVALSVLLGLAHPEQGLFIAAVAAAVRWSRDDGVAMGVGVLGGRLITEAYFRATGISVTRPRSSFVDLGISGFLEHHGRGGGWLLYCLWGPLWIVLGVIAWRYRTLPAAQQRQAQVVAVASAAAALPMLITLDETRVYAMITAPLLVPIAELITRIRPPKEAVIGFLAVVVLVPGVFTAGRAALGWELEFNDFLVFLINGNHPGDLTSWLFSPFNFVIPGA